MTARELVTVVCYLNNASRQLLEEALRDETFKKKHIIQGYINRLKYIEDDIYQKQEGEGKERFREEIKCGDTMLLANIAVALIPMEQSKRESVEKAIVAISKGEDFIIEQVDK